MQTQVLSTARLGVIREPKAPAADLKLEIARVSEWHQVPLPGSVLQSLFQNGSIPNPYKNFNSRELGWVARSRFVYLVPFKARKKTKTLENAFLILDGLDTFARVYLNGRMIMRPANAFRRWEADVTAALRWGGDNLLIVVLDPILMGESEIDGDAFLDPMGHPERLRVRRCQMSFGWPLCPPLVGPGIRRELRVEYRGPAWIEDLWVHAIYARREAAYMELKWRVRSVTRKLEFPLRLTVRVDKAGEEEKFSIPVEKFKISSNGLSGGFYEAWGTETLTWTNPALWFPHTHGEPRLHDMEADLRYGGVLWDRRADRYGVRVVEIERKPAAYSRETMRVLVNGEPVFIRGANWVPSDALSLDGDPKRLEHHIRKARALRMNLLRVWGGGLYESEEFYRLCDEMGLLVWQDFPFVDAPYPAKDERFKANVKFEAVDNIRRLRSHPSLALLCGNSGVEQTYRDTPQWNRRGPLEDTEFYTELLAGLCDDEAPGVPFLPGTPSGGDPPNEPLKGDSHGWSWWRENQPADRVLKPLPSFLTEFGVPSAPDPRTIEETIDHSHRHLASGIVEHTLGDNHHAMLRRIQESGLEPDWDHYLTGGWEMQSRATADVIERLRAAPEECGGVVIWTLNEPFPGFSWSMIDWALRPKPVAFRVQQAYADVVMRFVEEDRPLELRVVNDRPEPLEGMLRISLVSLEGEKLYEQELSVRVPARGMEIPWREALDVHTPKPRHTYLVTARLEHAEGVVRSHFYPAPVSKFLLPRPDVVLTIRPGKSETAIQFRSDVFVRWVLLQTDTPGNGSALIGFDLVPGEPVICGISPKARKARIRALSPGLQPLTVELAERQSIRWSE